MFGAGLGAILLLWYGVNKIAVPVVSESLENLDTGMDNIADLYVKKEMAWNEFMYNSPTLSEKYDNFLIYLGF